MSTDTQTVDKAFVEETGEEPRMPGHESAMDDKPDWQPRYPGSDRLKGKVAIVTGGDSGIGRATAILFAREGAKVAVAYLEEDDDARFVADRVADEGSEALLHRGDLGDPDVCRALIDKVISKWGRLDVLINNAGEQHPDKDIRDVYAEAKAVGYDAKIMRQIVRLRKMKPDDRAEMEAILDTYKAALGLG